MNASFLGQIRESLLEKRQTLTQWLSATPALKKQVRVGPAGEEALRDHLDVIDAALDKAETKTLGLCEVCHDYVDSELLTMDYTACVCIDHLSTEEMRSLEYELELSQVVQQALLPQHVPDIPGLEVAAFSRPAQFVSGDAFDFSQFRNGAHGFTISDVAGKGVSASLLMASVQTALRTLIPANDSPAEVIRELNRLFLHNIHFTTFVTLFLGAFDPVTRRLTYCNAGHNPPLIFRNKGNAGEPVGWLLPTGAAIGLVEESPFRVQTIGFSPGDILLLYTDGVTEARNHQGEEFGQEGLAAFVRQEANLSAKDLVQALWSALQGYTNVQQMADDVTLVACKVLAQKQLLGS
jgi:sigma-B regulation protein RsbU (phosphoserine phosphatase)